MRVSRKKRLDIYKKAYLLIESGKQEYICYAFRDLINGKEPILYKVANLFEEFILAMPERWDCKSSLFNIFYAYKLELTEEEWNQYYWHESDIVREEKRRNLRLTILSICIAMLEHDIKKSKIKR